MTDVGENERVDVGAITQRCSDKIPTLDPSQLETFLTEIVNWNPVVGLVSKQSTAAVLERLVVESSQLTDIIAHTVFGTLSGRQVDVVDIGTGAGFPGIIWKLKHPEISVTLVERSHKKVAFLERLVVVLRLTNVEVVAGEAFEVSCQHKYKEKFDLAVSLAVGPTTLLAKALAGLLRPGGYYCSIRPARETVKKWLVLRETVPTPHGVFCVYQRYE